MLDMLELCELSPKPQIAKDDDDWVRAASHVMSTLYGEEHVAYRIRSI
jgi:hypothetical protein